MDYRQLLTDNLPLVERVVRSVARRHCLRHDEADDLLGDIQLKLIENDYDVLRRFAGVAKLQTYLTTVVTNYALDERDKRLGKWRPSVYARRCGDVAILLEKYMTRDALRFDEAVQKLQVDHQLAESEKTLYRISLGFPQRTPRRFVSTEMLEQLSEDAAPDGSLDKDRRAALAQNTSIALNAALARLPKQDQLLLKMHFKYGLELSKISKVLKVQQKQLYRRKDAVLAILATELARLQMTRGEIRDILGEEFKLDLEGSDDVENR